jgi:hypothetical protein
MNQTEYMLRGLNGGQMQQLAYSLLPRLNYEWDGLIHSGNVEGTAQTRKGTPDMWKKTEEGGYIYIQVTADLRKGKMVEDLEKSIKSLEVDDVLEGALCIAFVSSERQPSEVIQCENLCKKYNIRFKFISNSAISMALDQKTNQDLRKKYLGIASDERLDVNIIMNQKNNLYIPLIEELKNLEYSFRRNDLFRMIEIPFIQKIIEKQYNYRVPNVLLCELIELKKFVDSFKVPNIYSITGDIITKFFIKGFEALYGQIIEGKIPIYIEDELIYYEDVYPEDYELIRLIAYDEKLIIGALNEQDFCMYDGEFFNKSLITMFEFALADKNKKHHSKRIAKRKINMPAEYYIASYEDFHEVYFQDQRILDKQNVLNNIKNLNEKLIEQVDQKLLDIFGNYEDI